MSSTVIPTDPDERNRYIASAVLDLVDGNSLREAATQRGISHETLRLWLLREVPAEYREAQELGNMLRVIEADNELENAPSHIGIARARERCKFARWDLERKVKRLFAPSQEISGPGGGPIQLEPVERAKRLAFANALGRVIDVEPEPSTSASS